jgi:hypothetical protein
MGCYESRTASWLDRFADQLQHGRGAATNPMAAVEKDLEESTHLCIWST